jgi:hypothetical protein|tara:strand:+ start:134 stop:343 length:210 start_codon:yes stop_codon:yes gene_type:complete
LLVLVVLVVLVLLVMVHQVVVALVVSVFTILNHSPHLLVLIQLLLVRVELVLKQEIVLTTPVEMEAIVY